jgi:hypothetical protein
MLITASEVVLSVHFNPPTYYPGLEFIFLRYRIQEKKGKVKRKKWNFAVESILKADYKNV